MNTESSKIVTSYFLKIASPESVYDWLKERAFDLSKHNCLPREYNDNGRADYKALLERNDELITLGLAQYARDSDVLERILDKACANAEMELACACLSNPHIILGVKVSRRKLKILGF